LKIEKEELSNNYKEQVEKIHLLLEEKDKIYSELDNMRTELNKVYQEKEKLNIEKEKLVLLKNKHEKEIENYSILLSKAEIDNSSSFDKFTKQNSKIDKDKEILQEEKRNLIEKIEALTSEITMTSNELDFVKHQENNAKTYIEKLEVTNRNLLSENQNFQLEIEKLKFNYENLQKALKEKKTFSVHGERQLTNIKEKLYNLSSNSISTSLINSSLNNDKNLVKISLT
jgi:exonuclease SbcC